MPAATRNPICCCRSFPPPERGCAARRARPLADHAGWPYLEFVKGFRRQIVNLKTTAQRIYPALTFISPSSWRAMLGGHNLSKASRNWKLVVLAGVAGFAVGLGFVFYCGPSRWSQPSTRRPIAVADVAGRRAVRSRRRGAGRAVRQCPPPRTGAHAAHRAQSYDAGPVHVRCRRTPVAVQRALPRNVRFGTRADASPARRCANCCCSARPPARSRAIPTLMSPKLCGCGGRGTDRRQDRRARRRPHDFAGQSSDPRRRLGRDPFRRHQAACAPRRSAMRCCSARSGGSKTDVAISAFRERVESGLGRSARARPP